MGVCVFFSYKCKVCYEGIVQVFACYLVTNVVKFVMEG